MLNREQKQAVEAVHGRVLILAGAGSGKTSVLSYRIAHLIQDHHVPPDSILGLTFTNKAAEEMRHRVGKIIGAKLAKKVVLCTFHSFCMQILRKEIHHLGYTTNFSLYNEKDTKRLVSQLARHLLGCEGDLPSLESTLEKIALTKSKGLKSEELDKEAATWHDGFAKDLYMRLQTCMRAYNAVDFDSLLSLTIDLFEKFPSILETYQNRFQYVMIDEYQDTNPIQYKLASFICQKHQNLCVVGDDDQSIYGWRGAEIKHILNFDAHKVIKLEQNYRSTPVILNAANAVIGNNKERHRKQLWSTHATNHPITLFHAPTEHEEALSVVQRIIHLRKTHNLAWKDSAILYRSNILSRTFESALMDAVWEKDKQWVRGIPYQVFGGTELYERAEIKDLVAYLKAILNPLDQESLLRIVNVPRRGISDKTLDLLTQANRKLGIPLWNLMKAIAADSSDFQEVTSQLSDRAKNGIRSFVTVMETAKEKFKQRPYKPTMEWFLEEINYRNAIKEDVKSDKMRDFKWENVTQCLDSIRTYEETMAQEGQEEEISLHHFLTTSLLDQESWQAHQKDLRDDKVTLMTIHSAKGLEFTACFLVGLEDHILPHEKSTSDQGIEEERRLMYVALTRAKTHLTLSMARTRKRMGKESTSSPSRFLFEIPPELLKISSWQSNE